MTDPLKISWSQLRVHEECHQKSALIRAGRKPKIKNIRNFYHGMVVDKVMRDWLHDPRRSTGDMVEMVSMAMKDVEADAKESGDGIVKWRDARDRTDVGLFCVELVRRLEPLLERHVLPWRHESATRFKAPISIPDLDGNPAEILLVGETDLMVHHEDGLHIWDLKGTADDHYWRKTLGQLYFYDVSMWAARQTPSVKVGFIQPMCAEQILEFTVTDTDRQNILTRIARMAHDVWRDEQTCKADTAGCSWCEVRHACPRFQIDDQTWSMSAALRAAAGEKP